MHKDHVAKIRHWWCISSFKDDSMVMQTGHINVAGINNINTMEWVINTKKGQELWEKYNKRQFSKERLM